MKKPRVRLRNKPSTTNVEQPISKPTPDPTQIVPYNESLLERSRTQWQFGDWESLAKIDRDALQHHPDRAKLALLAAAGHQQTGDLSKTRMFIRLAQDWGCGKKLISQMLISGVHNILGKAAALNNKRELAFNHFHNAIAVASPNDDTRLLAELRASRQIHPPPLPNSPDLLQKRFLESNSTPPEESLPDSHCTTAPAFFADNALRFPELHAALAFLHQTLRPSLYLELGVQQGHGLALAQCEAIGVGLSPHSLTHLPTTARVLVTTTDEFFAEFAKQYLSRPPDLILINNTHLSEHVVRDFIHCEGVSHHGTIIAIANALPHDPIQATRRRTGPDWTGDTWKLFQILEKFRPDLQLMPMGAPPNGLLIIGHLDRTNGTLKQHYQAIKDLCLNDIPPPDDFVQNKRIYLPTDEDCSAMLTKMVSKQAWGN